MAVTDTDVAQSEVRQITLSLPAWPVLVMLWGFPAWWALGLTVIVGGLMTVVMVSYLLIYRSVPAVPGVIPILAFLIWIFPCALMVDTPERLIGYFYRTSILVVVVVTFLYTLAAPATLTRRRILSALTGVWFFVIAAGLAAMVIPEVRLTTPVGMLLPASVSSNEYVQDLFFPPMAEIQTPYGSPTTFSRPAAPFPYANSWGVAIILLSPAAISTFILTRSLFLKALILAWFGAMIPPAIATNNRGMFAALGVMVVYIVVRLALRNRAAPVFAFGAIGILATVYIITSDFLESVATRQRYGDSTGTRAELYRLTFEGALKSPLLGYGGPRPSDVPGLSLGTQGYFWMLMFSYGFVGLVLFLTFLWGTTLRTFVAADDSDVVLHSALVAASGMIAIYGLDLMQLLTLVLIAAVLVRRRYLPAPAD